VNVTIEREVWKLAKIQAAVESRYLSDILTDALRLYLTKNGVKK